MKDGRHSKLLHLYHNQLLNFKGDAVSGIKRVTKPYSSNGGCGYR